MKINIFGLGYVGCVTAACLANDGHDVAGIDIDDIKIAAINRGKSPIIEPGLEKAIKSAVSAKRLKATKKPMGISDISIVCVGTPSNTRGGLNLNYATKVCEQIGCYLLTLDTYHVVNFRSTLLPTTVENILIPVLEKNSAKRAGIDFGVCMNPEFMREGSSLNDFYHPPFTVIGELDKKSGDNVKKIYKSVKAPLIRTTIKRAEMIKYVCNAFHALKVSFANEIGVICKNLDIDSHEVMDIVCQDKKLNISPYYLKPGFAFGGSCLPKDLRALLSKAKELDIKTELLDAILESNRNQIEFAYKLIKNTGKKKIGVLGLSFKAGTDDLRESPIVELIEKLIGKGFKISIYDYEVSLAKIMGSNKRYIEHEIPHISSLMKNSVLEVIDTSDVIIVSKKNKEFEIALRKIKNGKIVLDLVRIVPNPKSKMWEYQGLCW